MRRALLLFVALVSVPRAAWPQGDPLGPEFRVNTYTTNSQRYPSVATDSTGNFVVTWHSLTQDGSNDGVFGQRYANSGTPLGAEFRVNTFTTGAQSYPSVAADAAGNFVVVWDSAAQDGSSYGVFGQRYASSGMPLGPEFRVNTYTTNLQRVPSIAADSSGNFVIVWLSDGQDGSLFGVFGQRYASSGAPLGPEFRVNTYTTGDQSRPVVTSDPSGNFVVVWQSVPQDGSNFGVFGQRYASSGAPLGPEFRVNTYTTSDQLRPAVAADSSGNFVVVWQSNNQDGSGFGVFGQRYASTGAPVGPEFRVNDFTLDFQGYPSVAADSAGNFVVVWQSFFQLQLDLSGQRYSSTGAPLGTSFSVNTYTTDMQARASVVAIPSGDFVVTWQSNSQDGSAYGVYGQRYSRIVPVELMHFRVE